ncbi:hypothetical protein [Herminiimonas sp. CN]|uniref:hypothetical protein n=1 Tax=Herminiimonas sp. CN TaxID=1349818 RepID=UPI000473EE71|nr:hypothetical protein [Herminiimonas sp. CN]
MLIKQIRCVSAPAGGNRKAVRLPVLALLALSTAFAATTAIAASSSSEANARYRAEQAACKSGQSSQDRATCLREAGAALQESRKGRLNGADPGTYQQNALIRCNALPVNDRDACQRRIQGEGTTSGSVEGGGVLRELVVPDDK